MTKSIRHQWASHHPHHRRSRAMMLMMVGGVVAIIICSQFATLTGNNNKTMREKLVDPWMMMVAIVRNDTSSSGFTNSINITTTTTTSIILDNNNNDDDVDSVSYHHYDYPDDGHAKGILSNVSVAHLRSLQQEVDEQNHTERCLRYGFFYNFNRATSTSSSSPITKKKKRRIFYGANIADEPWELFEIVAAEAYGIFEGMVFVESNLTQAVMPRPFKRLHHDGILRRLFGAKQVQVRPYMNPTKRLKSLNRENMQRRHILVGWKEMGMTADDVGYIADPDETFSRDFLRAIQVCDGIDALDYHSHQCWGDDRVKLASSSRVFEMTPECIIRGYNWHHPDMVIGACIERIGNDTIHKLAPRRGAMMRLEQNGNDSRAPLWSPFEFRMTSVGKRYQRLRTDRQSGGYYHYYDMYTGYHFHNFFSDFNATRFKYFSFGHAKPYARVHPSLEALSDELKVGIRCIKNMTDDPTFRHKRVLAGFAGIKPNLPLYFLDEEYRKRRHAYMQDMVAADEAIYS